ncbi:MAG: hypothetical protein H6806_08860 [Planctomycetes bacterium]|nr:hypothetical protein [Planctomycetota bacterium]MCB9829854.1 hypothetical protein [Planctomycetota bacterium]MCB9901924.1 hypothetical protein [Planctomycetota bacterium]
MSNALPVPAPRHLTALPPADPDHHLWRNGRLWWIAMTVESAAGERWRVRRSLKTADIEEARRRRDELIQRARGMDAFRLAGRLA